MMMKLTSRKLVSMLVVALFMFPFAGIAVSQESQETEVETMTGMISDIMPDIGQIIVVEESGKAVTLTAGQDVDIKNFNVGDHVVVECTSDMVVISINKQTE